jgi:hypothetical protein
MTPSLFVHEYTASACSSNIKPVMRRVYVIWAIRTMSRPLGRVLLTFICVYEILVEVSVRNVYSNAKISGNSLFFAKSAFLNTDILIQGSIVGAVLLSVSFGRDIARGIQSNLPSPLRVIEFVKPWSKA